MKRDIPVWLATTTIVLGRWVFSGSAAWFIIANATGHESEITASNYTYIIIELQHI